MRVTPHVVAEITPATPTISAEVARLRALALEFGARPDRRNEPKCFGTAIEEVVQKQMPLPVRIDANVMKELLVGIAFWGSYHGPVSWGELTANYASVYFPPRPELDYLRVVAAGVRLGLVKTDLAKNIGWGWHNRRESFVAPTARLYDLLDRPTWSQRFVRWAAWYGKMNAEANLNPTPLVLGNITPIRSLEADFTSANRSEFTNWERRLKRLQRTEVFEFSGS